MSYERIKAVQFDGYKSFPRGTIHEIDLTPIVSVIIGKNNCGKSSCMDVIECAYRQQFYKTALPLFNRVSMVFRLDEMSILCGFRKNVGGGDVPSLGIGRNHYDYGILFDGKRIVADFSSNNTLELSEVQPDLELPKAISEWKAVVRSYADFQTKYEFRRMNAERDLVPEIESVDENVGYDGTGATNLLRKFINHSQYDEKLVEERLLNELNKIMQPESHFKSIRVQQIDENQAVKWEVFLEEDDGRRFALSKSGSGLKTILLMLINLLILPQTNAYKNRKIVYAFEELENNLHPALQRRVFEYIYNFAKKNNVQVFITTHSHIAINTLFEKDKMALYHVQKQEGVSQITSIKDRASRLDVLSDLDVKASDLFQSNGVIWVEGPSDRIYINHWLKTFCGSEYIEGSHYQFLYYGGRSLSHYTADENLEGFISILKTNQNAAIVMDSDKKNERGKINATKTRIRKEFEAMGGVCWITKGKEIENYIPTESLRMKYDSSLPELRQYDLFPDYIEKMCKSFTSQKVSFAKSIVKYITLDNSKNIMDLKKQVEKLYLQIQKWNR